MKQRAAALGALVATAALALPAAARAAPPTLAPGRYHAEFCVANPRSAPPGCGPMTLQVVSPQRLVLQLADVSYRLELRASQLALVVKQGAMQLDEFDTDYTWADGVLRFVDPDKDIAYAIRPGARQR